MKSVVGIFGTRQEAERAASTLDSAGIAKSRIAVLTPQSTAQEIAAVPTMDAEQPGMGMALGATVGGAMGLAGGVTLGALASVLIPGVGPILGIGFAAGALGFLGGGGEGGWGASWTIHFRMGCRRKNCTFMRMRCGRGGRW